MSNPPYGNDGTPTVWTRSDGQHVYPADAYRDGGEHNDVIPWDHSYLHAGKRFYTYHRDLAVANGAALDFLFEVGDTLNPHFLFFVRVGGDFLIDFYGGVDADGDGTLLPVQNYNQEVTVAASVAPETVARLNPTINDIGALGFEGMIIGGTAGTATGSEGNGRQEIIMARNLKYLLRFTNNSGLARKFAIQFDWYEHEPVGIGVS